MDIRRARSPQRVTFRWRSPGCPDRLELEKYGPTSYLYYLYIIYREVFRHSVSSIEVDHLHAYGILRVDDANEIDDVVYACLQELLEIDHFHTYTCKDDDFYDVGDVGDVDGVA